jgi:hypothetical protein
VSLTAFSQTATNNNQQTKCFPLPVVKKITKDLLSGDSAKAQLKLTENQLIETEKKSIMKDSVISLLRVKENNYLTIIDAHTQKYSVLEDHTKKVEWNLKKEKIKGKFTSILSGVVILTLTGLLITH